MIYVSILFEKLEFDGQWPLTMRYGLRRSNSILWAPRLVACFALRMEFDNWNLSI